MTRIKLFTKNITKTVVKQKIYKAFTIDNLINVIIKINIKDSDSTKKKCENYFTLS
jgi:hypothetical protein